MNLTQFVVQNILNFQSLTLLISRIIIDGSIDTIEIISDSNSLNNLVLSDIMVQLPTDIQILTTNVADEDFSKNCSWPVEKWMVTDRTIQLVFLEKKHVNGHFGNFPKKLDQKKIYNLILYRLFVLLVENDASIGKYVISHRISKFNADMSALIAICDVRRDQTELYLYPNKLNPQSEENLPIYVQHGRGVINGGIFDSTMGYWHQNPRFMVTFYTRWTYYEQFDKLVEENPKRNRNWAIGSKALALALKGVEKIIVDERLRVIANDSTLTLKIKLKELKICGPGPPCPRIYEMLFLEYQDFDLSYL